MQEQYADIDTRQNVSYDDLPNVLVDAFVSVEDYSILVCGNKKDIYIIYLIYTRAICLISEDI